MFYTGEIGVCQVCQEVQVHARVVAHEGGGHGGHGKPGHLATASGG